MFAHYDTPAGKVRVPDAITAEMVMDTKTEETREQTLRRLVDKNHQESWKHKCNAESLLRAARHPCDGVHKCEDDHGDDECDCDLTCECDADSDRQDAAIYASLAATAATVANTYALVLARELWEKA